ncbi:MAG: hypothetical protein IH614_05815 [Desulfuromonadales bacterium]|nr:hypothetical protein [Desulfuromonadales bacterium]
MSPRNLSMLFLTLGALLLITGCGGSSSDRGSAVDPDDGREEIAMQLDQEYEVIRGDVVISEDAETRIAVRHVFEGDKKFITLLAGSATLIHGVR